MIKYFPIYRSSWKALNSPLHPLKMVLPFLWSRNMEFLKIIRFTQRVLYHYLKFLLVPRILCKLVVTKENHEEFEVKWRLIDNQRYNYLLIGICRFQMIKRQLSSLSNVWLYNYCTYDYQTLKHMVEPHRKVIRPISSMG